LHDEEPTVDTPTTAYSRMAIRRELPRLLLGGTSAMRAAALAPNVGIEVALRAQTAADVLPMPDRPSPHRSTPALITGYSILPMEEGETVPEYTKRLYRTPVKDFFGDALDEHAGRLFRRPPQLRDDVPLFIRGQDASEGVPATEGRAAVPAKAKVDGVWENIDRAGRHGDIWGADVFRMAEADGMVACLVDKPRIPRDVLGRPVQETLEQAIKAKRTPYFVEIAADDLIEATPRFVNGTPRLAIVRFRHNELRRVGLWGEQLVRQVYVYYDGLADSEQADPTLPKFLAPAAPERYARYELHEHDGGEKNDPENWKIVDAAPLPLREIPIRVLVLEREGPFEGAPPLLSLAESCLEHWRKASDRDNILHVVSVPVLYRTGWTPADDIVGDQAQIGVNRTLYTSKIGAEAKWIEHDGKAIGTLVEDIANLERLISQQSLEPLLPATGRITATDAALRENKANSRLERWALAYKDFLEGLLDLAAQYQGMAPGSGGSVEINKDGLALIGAADFPEVRALKDEGILDKQTTFEEAKRRSIVADAVDWVVVQKRVAEEAKAAAALAPKMTPSAPTGNGTAPPQTPGAPISLAADAAVG